MQAYKNCMNVLKQGDFDVIHCNTPIGGVIGRFCGKRAKVRKIIYTAHGFHFYKGAPLLNCTVLKWAEMFMAHYTDAIITINQEDYERAQKFHLRNQGNVYYVPGVGIDTSQYIADKQLRTYKRNELGVEEGDIVLISVGELNSNKNHQVIISALGEIQNKKIHYFLCGVGDKEEDLKRQSKKCGIEENVHFLGYRTDVKQLLNSSDIFVIPSKREGLSRAMMEAMASGLPCIASRIRGNVDLLENGEGGYLVEVQDVHGIADKIRVLSGDKELREKMKKANLERIKKFDVKVVKKTLEEIYREALG
jgi:glycosyltransferase involved in cell wall biosynthesis